MVWFSEPTEQTARIRHQCEWCGQKINAGAHYVRYVTDFDGFTIIKLHPECYAAMLKTDGIEEDGFLSGEHTRPGSEEEAIECSKGTT